MNECNKIPDGYHPKLDDSQAVVRVTEKTKSGLVKVRLGYECEGRPDVFVCIACHAEYALQNAENV